MVRPIKYNQLIINEIHHHGFVEDKLKNDEIAEMYNLTENQLEYILYKCKCTNVDCPRCNPRITILERFRALFRFK